MQYSHYFQLFSPPITRSRDLLSSFLGCFYNCGFELEEGDWGDRTLDVQFNAFQSSTELSLSFRMIEDKNDDAGISIFPNGDQYYTNGCSLGYIIITVNQMDNAWMDESELRWKKIKRFQRILSVLKLLTPLVHAYYGYSNSYETYPEYFVKYINIGKARFPFDQTFWGTDYPTRPNTEIQEQLKALGYQVENTQAGTWLYRPVEERNSPDVRLDGEKVKEILGYDDDEGFTTIWAKPNDK